MIVFDRILNRIKYLLNQKERRIVIENFVSLLAVQGANYILPLITIPYLIRVLGIGGFGLYSFIYAFTQYFIIMTDYGFNLTATREVSINRDDQAALSRIFSTVFMVKIIIFIFCCILFCGLVFSIDKFRNHWGLYMIMMIGIFGNLIFPVWYYQGLEKTKYIAIMNFVSRLFATICVFIFIKNQRHLGLAIALQSSGVAVAGLLSLTGIAMFWPVKLVKTSISEIKKTFIGGWNVFVTVMSSTLVNNTNVFILGLFANNEIVGYYSVAEKIIRVFINLAAPINNAIFPRVSKLYNESKERGTIYLRKIIRLGTIGFFVCIISLIIFSDILIRLVAGVNSPQIKQLLLIMSVLPLTIFWDNIYGTQVLINIGRTADFMKAVLIPGIISLIVSLVFVPIYGSIATAVIYLISELMILIMMVYYVRRKSVFLLRDGLI
jgi:PST family polysaccharide transporter